MDTVQLVDGHCAACGKLCKDRNGFNQHTCRAAARRKIGKAATVEKWNSSRVHREPERMIFSDGSHERIGDVNHGVGAFIIVPVADAQWICEEARVAFGSQQNETKAAQSSRQMVMEWQLPHIITEVGPDTNSTDMEVKTAVAALTEFERRGFGTRVVMVTDCQGMSQLFDGDGRPVRDLPSKPHFHALADIVQRLDVEWRKVAGHGPMKTKFAQVDSQWEAIPFTCVDQAARDALKAMRQR